MLTTEIHLKSSPTSQQIMEHCRQTAEAVHDIENFKKWTRDHVRPVLPHEALACVHGLIYGVGISLDYLVTVDYPVEHLQAIRNASGHMDTPLASRWAEQKAPVFFDANYPTSDIPSKWLEHFKRHELKNAAVDGVIDTNNCIATYFSFHRLPNIDEALFKQIFALLTPVLHQTFTRVIRNYKQSNTFPTAHHNLLTNREVEIAAWISQGKSNNDIANLLQVTENTVRNHLSRIFQKTGCNNRSSLAVAIVQQEQQRFGIGTRVL